MYNIFVPIQSLSQFIGPVFICFFIALLKKMYQYRFVNTSNDTVKKLDSHIYKWECIYSAFTNQYRY